MKKYFAYAFILIGLLVSIVSCAPIVRLPIDSIKGAEIASDFSFLGAAMLLAFASLCTMIGVLLYTRFASIGSPPANSAPPTTLSAVLLNLSPLVLFAGIPMAHLLLPLWVAASKSSRRPGLCREAVRVLNFQLTWTLYTVVALMLCIVVVGIPLLAMLLIFNIAVMSRAAWRSAHGGRGSYPLSLGFIT